MNYEQLGYSFITLLRWLCAGWITEDLAPTQATLVQIKKTFVFDNLPEMPVFQAILSMVEFLMGGGCGFGLNILSLLVLIRIIFSFFIISVEQAQIPEVDSSDQCGSFDTPIAILYDTLIRMTYVIKCHKMALLTFYDIRHMT